MKIRQLDEWVSETLEAPPPEYLVEDLIPQQGICLLSAQPKTGKTFLAMAIGLAVSAGKRFEGITPCSTPRSVFYALEEGGAWENANRMRVVAQGRVPSNSFMSFRPSIKLTDAASAKDLLETVKKINPGLVVLDPFFRMINGNENDAEVVNKALNVVYQIRKATDASVLILTHCRKGANSEDPDDDIRGSGVLSGSYDAHIALRWKTRKIERMRDDYIAVTVKGREQLEMSGEVWWELEQTRIGNRKVWSKAIPHLSLEVEE